MNGDAYTDLQSSHTVSYANGNAQPTAYRYWFDVTNLAKQWAAGIADQTKGIIFKASDTTEAGNTHIYKTFGSYNRASYKPSLKITYIDIQGENTTYDYDTQTLGENVTIKTNVSFGNIVVTHSMNKLLGAFPITPAMIYNSSTKYSEIFDKYGLDSSTHGKFGAGWKLNLIEFILPVDDSYLYVDGSGTEFIFACNSEGVYENEALGADLTIGSDETYMLELADESVRTFSSVGLITSLEYADEVYTYTYENGKLTNIKNSKQKTIFNFVYGKEGEEEKDYLLSVENPPYYEDSDKTVGYEFEYVESTLNNTKTISKIKDVYDNEHTYSISKLLFQVYNALDGFGYKYTFNANMVSAIEYYRQLDDITSVKNIAVGYIANTVLNTTSTSYTSDNKITYILDEKFRTANIIVTSIDGSILYDASAYSYDNEKVNAYIVGAGSENLLANSSLENTSGWSGTFTQSAEEALFGAKSAKLTSNGNSVKRNLTLSAGNYMFSAYVKFITSDEENTSSNSKIRLTVKNNSGTEIKSSEYLSDSSDGGWIRMTLPFSVATSGTYTISVELSNASEAVYVDCLQLERGTSATTYNALLNGEFESGVTSWTNATSAATPIFGSKSASVASTTTQAIGLGSAANNRSFIISAWAKTASETLDDAYVKLTFATEDGIYEVSLPFGEGIFGKAFLAYEVTVPNSHETISNVTVALVNESGNTVYFDNILLSFGSEVAIAEESTDNENNSSSTDSTQSLSFSSNEDGTCILTGIGTYTDITVVIPSVSPNGDTVISIGEYAFAYCTNIESVVIPESVTDIEEGAFYNCTSLKNVYLPSSLTYIGFDAFCDCSDELKVYFAGTSDEWAPIYTDGMMFSGTVTFIYNSERIGDLLYTYTRDSYGNITSTTVSYVGSATDANNTTHTIVTHATYDSLGNLLSYTNELNKTTTYTYDSYGNVLTVTDAKGTVTSYAYYSNGLLKSTSCNGMTNTYTYTNGLLTSVTHTGAGNYSETYTFVYNAYGNVISVNVGSHNIVTYTYTDNGKGNLSTLEYANGDTETYTYDALGNQTGIFMEGVQKYNAVYDLYGNLLSETDTVTGNTTRYYADEYGSYTYMFTFDASGNIVDTAIPESPAALSETYDVFDRLTSTSLDVGDVDIIKNFTYTTKNGESSYQISGETFSDGTIERKIAYNYEYDALGNLTNVAESGIINASGTNQTKYYYDSLSQLVREDNPYDNKTYTYEYDGNGNITSKKTYAYTTGEPETLLDTVTYGYTDSNWKDKLTSYDGTSISYDASGNPLNWTDYRELTWVGRQLDSIMSPDGALWTFKYDHNGLRTERVQTYMNELVLRSTYTWVDEKLVKEYRVGTSVGDAVTLEYFYDGEELVGFTYNGENYYYGKTNNGEIRFIYNSDGEIVTTYLYDAWGTPISITGSLASTVGQINPFRYKSYYYDSETRLYYLRSRSYDPAVGRFLNADSVEYLGETETLLSYNLFAYCENNPTKNIDPNGELLIAILIGSGIGLIAGGLIGYGIAKWFNVPKSKTWKYVLGGAVIGALIGGCIGYAVGASSGAGAVLWSGKDMAKAAGSFAKANGLKTIGHTLKGKLLNVLDATLKRIVGRNTARGIMKPLWDAASSRFVISQSANTTFVHVFITAQAYTDMNSTFNRIEMAVIAELGLRIIWHFVQ